jgi:hypothetical protein
MVRPVTRFEAYDGNEFPTQVQAERHERDLLCQVIDHIIKTYFPTGHAPTTFEVVKKIANDPDDFEYRLKQISHLIESVSEASSENILSVNDEKII